MGKSIRSKREKRLRTLRRKIAEPHYAAKDEARAAMLDAIVNSPSQYTLDVGSKKAAAELAAADLAQRLDSDAGDASELHAEAREEDATEAMAVEGAVGERKGKKAPKKSIKPGRRGGSMKKKVKLTRKVKRTIKKKAQFPV